MNKPLNERNYIQIQAWVGQREIQALQRLQEQTGTTRSAVLRGLLNGEITVEPAPTNASTTEDRHRTI